MAVNNDRIVNEVFNILRNNKGKFSIFNSGSPLQQINGEKTNLNKTELAKLLGVNNNSYLKFVLKKKGTYLDIPISDTGYFLNVINVVGDGNCGLYSLLLGMFLKNPTKYENYIETLKSSNVNRKNLKKLKKKATNNNRKQKAQRGELVPNLALRPHLKRTKKNYQNVYTDELEALREEARVIQLSQIPLDYNAFKEPEGKTIDIDNNILILHTGKVNHFKVLDIRNTRFKDSSSNDNGGGGRKNNGKSNNSSSKLTKNTVNRHRSTSRTNSPLNRFTRSNANGNASTVIRGNASTVRRNVNGNVNGSASTIRRGNASTVIRHTNRNASTVRRGNASTVRRNANGNVNGNVNSSASTIRRGNATPGSRNSSNANNINRRLPCVICGGSQFVYVSKVGKRKLRYTKTGRKYVISNGKRKYLK